MKPGAQSTNAHDVGGQAPLEMILLGESQPLHLHGFEAVLISPVGDLQQTGLNSSVQTQLSIGTHLGPVGVTTHLDPTGHVTAAQPVSLTHLGPAGVSMQIVPGAQRTIAHPFGIIGTHWGPFGVSMQVVPSAHSTIAQLIPGNGTTDEAKAKVKKHANKMRALEIMMKSKSRLETEDVLGWCVGLEEGLRSLCSEFTWKVEAWPQFKRAVS